MRKDENHVWECFQWLSYAVLLSLCLNRLKRVVTHARYRRQLEHFERTSNLPWRLAEDWAQRYSPEECEFLARVATLSSGKHHLLDLHRCLANSRRQGVEFVDAVLHWLLGGNAKLLLEVIDFVLFVGDQQHAIPSDVVSSSIHHFILHNKKSRKSARAIEQGLIESERLNDQLQTMGLLVKGLDGYCTTAVVLHKRPPRLFGCHKAFIQDLRLRHPAYASQYLIQLMLKSWLFQGALQVLGDDQFCAMRVLYLKDEAANHHIQDCLLVGQVMEDANMHYPNFEPSCLQLAHHIVDDGASCLVLGQFLRRQQGLSSSELLLVSARESAMRGMQTEALLLSKLFKRVSTVYQCHGECKQVVPNQYKDLARTLISSCCRKNGDLESVLLHAIVTHARLEGQRAISSFGLEHQVGRLEARLAHMAHHHVSVCRDACLALGNDERAAVLGQIVDVIHSPSRQNDDDEQQDDDKQQCAEDAANQSSSSEQSQTWWTNVSLKFEACALPKGD